MIHFSVLARVMPVDSWIVLPNRYIYIGSILQHGWHILIHTLELQKGDSIFWDCKNNEFKASSFQFNLTVIFLTVTWK